MIQPDIYNKNMFLQAEYVALLYNTLVSLEAGAIIVAQILLLLSVIFFRVWEKQAALFTGVYAIDIGYIFII